MLPFEKHVKADFVTVLGKNPFKVFYTPPMKLFNYYLIPLAEPCEKSANWKPDNVIKHLHKVLDDRERKTTNPLYIDSGGFQIIKGHIPEHRIKEYIDVYHLCLKLYSDRIDKIFSLDVNCVKYTRDEIKKANIYSTRKTLKMVDEIPELREKILYVLVSRNLQSFEIWRELFVEEKVWEKLDRFSIGGLVGLKGLTKSDFNHAVPATLWILTYAKHYNFDVKQIHWLGQSSKVIFFTMLVMEKIFDVYLTSDSSELVKIQQLQDRFPLLHRETTIDLSGNVFHDFKWVGKKNLKDLEEMAKYHSMEEDLCGKVKQKDLLDNGFSLDILHFVPIHLIDLCINRFPDYDFKILVNELLEYCTNKQLTSNNIIFKLLKVDSVPNIDNYLNQFIDENRLLSENDAKNKKLINNFRCLKFFRYNDSWVRGNLENGCIDQLRDSNYTWVSTTSQIDLCTQHIMNTFLFAQEYSDIVVENYETINIEELKEIHPVLTMGNFAKDIYANLQYIKLFKDIVETGNIEEADNILRTICTVYEDKNVTVNDFTRGLGVHGVDSYYINKNNAIKEMKKQEIENALCKN